MPKRKPQPAPAPLVPLDDPFAPIPGSDVADAFKTLRQLKGIMGEVSQTLKSIDAKLPTTES